ncbi:response regulator LiaR [Paenibacillus pini JCM 16418]|uniref:Response regulator LiaR n=1 Tax=Paenibacillus pini JCM 16418 TaxID=1236976 RepID=W7YUU2_9BACL|nr:response regulator LiaR [Paenibacillus pini JCM 16418]
MEGTNIKVLIVDDHDMVRMGLKTYLMLEPKFEVVGEAEHGGKVMDLLRDAAPDSFPDLILMDLMMPVMNGAETTRAVLAQYPTMKIVILTSFLEDELVVDAIEAGA